MGGLVLDSLVSKKNSWNTNISFPNPAPFAAEISRMLNSASILHSDFEPIIDQAVKGDLIFVDPPYTVKHNLNNFIKYNEKLFSWNDQLRLRDSVERAVQRGATVIVTNADHPSIKELYKDFSKYISLYRESVLAGKAEYRRGTTEAMFIVAPE